MGGRHHRRIAQRCAVLNPEPADRVAVVAHPGLREVIHHPRVHPCATGGAVFKQHLGETAGQRLQHPVQAQHIAVQQLVLALRRQAIRARLADAAVAVPLDIGDVGAGKHPAQAVDQVILHLGAGQVQTELVPPLAALAPVDVDAPIGVAAVELAVRRHHLRLHPQPKLQPQGVDLPGKPLQAARQLFFIFKPVPQGAGVVVAVTKPAVVQHQHLDARLCRPAGQLQHALVVEPKIERPPRC